MIINEKEFRHDNLLRENRVERMVRLGRKRNLLSITEKILLKSKNISEIERICSFLKIMDSFTKNQVIECDTFMKQIFESLANDLFDHFTSEVIESERVKILIPQYISMWSTMFQIILNDYPLIKRFIVRRSNEFFDNIYYVFVRKIVFMCLQILENTPESKLHQEIIDRLGEQCPHVVSQVLERYIKSGETKFKVHKYLVEKPELTVSKDE